MRINKIEPPFWFADMNCRSLQLLVYGEGLTDVKVKTGFAEKCDVVHSNNGYAIVELYMNDNVECKEYSIEFTNGSERLQWGYPIYPRRNKSIKGLTPQDVIYLIMPDRFARVGQKTMCQERQIRDVDRKKPDAWHGGNMKGVKEHLDYLADLGVTSLWLTPVLRNNKNPERNVFTKSEYAFYHGYAITDFYNIDEHFGNLDDYCDLVDATHQKGLKVIKDIVFNHCGIEHPWVSCPPTDDWINHLYDVPHPISNKCTTTIFDKYASDKDKEETVSGWFTEYMPDLNLRNEYVVNYLIQMTIWWIEVADIDAIRMDTYLYSDFDAMEKWLKRLDTEYPKFPVIAEIWVGDKGYVSMVQRKLLQANGSVILMDFAFQEQLEGTFSVNNKDKEQLLYRHFASDFLYEKPKSLLTFLDNHDMPRWGYTFPENLAIQKLAFGILLTIPRIPQILYGSELMLVGDGTGCSNGCMRQDFPGGWKDDKPNLFNPAERTDEQKELFAYIKSLLHFRKGSSALTQGTMKHYIPQNGAYVYVRQYKEDKIMIMANFSDRSQNIDLGRYKEDIEKMEALTEVVNNRKFDVTPSLMCTLKRYEIKILSNK